MTETKNNIDKTQILKSWKELKNINKFLKKLAVIFFGLGVSLLITFFIIDLLTVLRTSGFGKFFYRKDDDYAIKIQAFVFSLFLIMEFLTTTLIFPLLWGKKSENFFNFFYWEDFNEGSFENVLFNHYLNLLKKGKKLLKIKFFFLFLYILIFGFILFFYFFIL